MSEEELAKRLYRALLVHANGKLDEDGDLCLYDPDANMGLDCRELAKIVLADG